MATFDEANQYLNASGKTTITIDGHKPAIKLHSANRVLANLDAENFSFGSLLAPPGDPRKPDIVKPGPGAGKFIPVDIAPKGKSTGNVKGSPKFPGVLAVPMGPEMVATLPDDAMPSLRVRIGGAEKNSRIQVLAEDLVSVFYFDAHFAALYIGGDGHAGDVFLADKEGNPSIHLNGADSDIELKGADCAEEFSISDDTAIVPGAVLVIGDNRQLHACGSAYDSCVAGVVSGAGDLQPGIVLGQGRIDGPCARLALSGTVQCLVDAACAPIRTGDLLTTSSTAGHAMKATDRDRAFGSVIGKALSSLDKGRGLIPVLVSLQ